jgi:pyrroline-5-carboxylate reductase
MQIAIIGCGVIGGTFARYLARHHSMTVYDKNSSSSHSLSLETNAFEAKNPLEAIDGADMIILAVKPQNLNNIAEKLHGKFKNHQLLVSVLMGTTLAKLRQFFSAPSIIRMMQNTPMIYREGVLGIVEDPSITSERKKMIEETFSDLGLIYWTSEEKIDAITALAASSPAYIFVLLEAMIDAGVYLGIPAIDARKLVIQALQGSLTMFKESGKNPSELKWEVTSPGGSTIEGIRELERQGMRAGMMNTILAGYEKIKKSQDN